MFSHLLFSFLDLYLLNNICILIKERLGYILQGFISKKVKVQSSCADQNSNCILGKMPQIIYFIKLGRDEVHTISSTIIIENIFAKKKKQKKKLYEY